MKALWILMAALLPAAGGAQERAAAQPLPLSLRRAVEIALAPEGNIRTRLAREGLDQAGARSAQARAALLPNLSSSLNYRDQTVNLRANGLRFHIPVIEGAAFSFPALVGPYTVMDARISGTQSIFDYGSIRRFQSARAAISAARREVESAEEEVAARVARAYLSAIRADADLEAAGANVTLSEGVLSLAENQKAAGASTGIEITRARVQLANDRQRLLVAETARRRAHMELLRAMNLELAVALELTDRLGYVPADPATLESATALALAGRPDLGAQRERERSARLASSAVKMERLPSLSFFGDYGTIGGGFEDALPTRAYGITLRLPIFDGGRMDARRAESASLHRAEKARTADLEKEIELDVRLALDALNSAREQIEVSREGLGLAENELAQARRRYEAGVSFGLEVTDAQTRLERARDNQIQALYNYNLARIDLEQAMGAVRGRLP